MRIRPVAVLGARGYVGGGVCRILYARNSMPSQDTIFAVFPVTRATCEHYRVTQFHQPYVGDRADYDVLINCAMPGSRYRANQDPARDYQESVVKTKAFRDDWSYNKFVQISSLSARCERSTPYGYHRREAEKLLEGREALVVRLTAMYSPNLSRGVLYDMLQGHTVHSSAQSRFAFASLDTVGAWIASHLDLTGLVEVGAKNTIALGEIADALKLKVKFDGPIDVQEVEHPRPEFPDARDVIAFMKEIRDAVLV